MGVLTCKLCVHVFTFRNGFRLDEGSACVEGTYIGSSNISSLAVCACVLGQLFRWASINKVLQPFTLRITALLLLVVCCS